MFARVLKSNSIFRNSLKHTNDIDKKMLLFH